MMRILELAKTSVGKLRTWRERSHMRQQLLGKSDRLLADMGMSREFLTAGVRSWPWCVVEEDDAEYTRINQERIYRRAVAELNAYTDAELTELALTRGGIEHAVRHGRPGFDEGDQAHAA